MRAAHRPAAHHGVGHFRVELQREAGAGTESLDREGLTSARSSRRAAGRSPRGATDTRGRAIRRRSRAPGLGRPDGVVADLGVALRMRARRALPRCRAIICAPRQMPRNGFPSRSGTPIQSISRLTKSSPSLALCGRRRSRRRRARPSSPAADRRTAGGGCRADSRACVSTWPTRPGWNVPGAGR